MGKGQIISGGVAGLYQVKLLLNTARLSAEIIALNGQIALLDARIAMGINTVEFTSQISALNEQIAALDEQIAAETDPTKKKQLEAEKITLQSTIVALTARANTGLYRLEHQKTAAQVRINFLTAIIPGPSDNIVSAWCADLTENLTGLVGTIEIPGERGAVMIQPGYGGNAVYNAARDGQLQPGSSATPAGCFYNLAMLPGWQKWKPTYRFGVISNLSGDTCTVALDAATSSQRGLNVNQGTVLTNVPITYMTSNGASFADGDEVLVKFIGQDFAAPVVIGFKDNPQGFETTIPDGSFELNLWIDYQAYSGHNPSNGGRQSGNAYDGAWLMLLGDHSVFIEFPDPPSGDHWQWNVSYFASAPFKIITGQYTLSFYYRTATSANLIFNLYPAIDNPEYDSANFQINEETADWTYGEMVIACSFNSESATLILSPGIDDITEELQQVRVDYISIAKN